MPTAAERERYARRAMELRAIAAAVQDAELERTLMTLIKSYDELVEEPGDADTPPSP